MDNNQMIKYKEGFMSKIKKLFQRILGKNHESLSYIKYESFSEENQERNEIQDKPINDIKVNTKEIDKVIEKRNFLEEIEGNEEMLNMLSIDRLKKLERYYEEIIEQNNKKIEELKAS